MKTNSPSFGMALKQKDITSTISKLNSRQMKNYLSAANKIHKASEKSGFDVTLTKGIDYQKTDEIFLGLKSKKHPEINYQKTPITMIELKYQAQKIADGVADFLKEESERLKNMDKITNRFGK